MEDFSTLYSRHFARVCRIVSRAGVRSEWVEDVAQESFVKAYRNFSGAFDGENFNAWIATIARNGATDWLRLKANKSQDGLPDEADPVADGSELLEQMIDRERYQALDDCMQRSNAEEQTVVRGKIEGRSSAEIGLEINKTANQVDKIYFNAKQKLLKCVLSKFAPSGEGPGL